MRNTAPLPCLHSVHFVVFDVVPFFVFGVVTNLFAAGRVAIGAVIAVAANKEVLTRPFLGADVVVIGVLFAAGTVAIGAVVAVAANKEVLTRPFLGADVVVIGVLFAAGTVAIGAVVAVAANKEVL
eukprot:CAMPEP_0180421612 /NCGR_PEP_ID=MMETSP1036_2-20121128/3242_1 /TAXON_ID=632150 /ORGANISM="Azadinium spinosum, Strain 3D9" /LENGTH=125 /DNA_ID=CAMNT_0022426885 /DNA_START=338 /DNA_END=711 /DNA_ORIENTATION=-